VVDAAFDYRIYRNYGSRVKKRLPTSFLTLTIKSGRLSTGERFA
jgi:hypothetical protein